MKTSYGADAILVLSKKGENFGFYELATTNVPARKAFLPINDPSGAREFTMVFDDVAGISEELRVKNLLPPPIGTPLTVADSHGSRRRAACM